MEKNQLILEVLKEQPFFGTLLSRATFQEGNEFKVELKNGVVITTNKEFECLLQAEKKLYLIHEISKQLGTRQSKNTDIWNIQTERYPS